MYIYIYIERERDAYGNRGHRETPLPEVRFNILKIQIAVSKLGFVCS